MDYGKVPSVAKLAEKYEDFQMLVTVCQGIGSSAKLKEYMVRFKEQVGTKFYMYTTGFFVGLIICAAKSMGPFMQSRM